MNEKIKAAIGNLQSCGVNVIPAGIGYDVCATAHKENTRLDYTGNTKYNSLILKNTGNTDIILWGCYTLCPGEHLLIGTQSSLNYFRGKIPVIMGKSNTLCDCKEDGTPADPEACLMVLEHYLIGERA